LRFNNFVTEVLGEEVKDQIIIIKIKDYAENINGGWEVWLQVQHTRLKSTTGVRAFAREVPYPSGGQRCDFAFVPANADDTKIRVELKVQRNAGAEQSVNDFVEDIKKVRGVDFDANDTAGAAAVIPCNTWNAIQYLKQSTSDYFRVSYCLVDSSNISAPANIGIRPPDQATLANKVLLL